MKPRKPKPVILEPAHVSLLRLGREMGATDVPTAELVASPLWSMEASREVDRVIEYRERREFDLAEDVMRRGMTYSRRCYGCGATCTSFGTAHADDCDLDLTKTAQQRWKLRNPERAAGYARITKIKRRWAFINRDVAPVVEAARAA